MDVIMIKRTPAKVNTCGHIIRAATPENQQSAYAKPKEQISCAVSAQLISAFVFAAWIVQSLFYLNTKSQASSLVL